MPELENTTTTNSGTGIGGDLGVPASIEVSLPTTNAGSASSDNTEVQISSAAPKQEVSPEQLAARQPIDETVNAPEFEDFTNFLDSGISKPVTKKGDEVVKPKQEQEVKKEEQQQAIAATKSSSASKVERDYSGFTDEEKPLMQKMSNDSFAFVRSKLAELKKRAEDVNKLQTENTQLKLGKTTIPETLYEHPQGFILTPEFNVASKKLNDMSLAQGHWQEQLAKIRKGEDWNGLSWDTQGNLIINAQAQKADGRGEAQVLGYITGTGMELNERQREVLAIQNSWQSKNSEGTTFVQNVNKQYFAHADDPKFGMKVIKDDLLSKFPAQFQKNPLIPLLLNSLATNIALQNEMKKASSDIAAEKEKATKINVATKNSGPTEGSMSAGTSGGKGASSSDVTMDDFKRVLAGA